MSVTDAAARNAILYGAKSTEDKRGGIDTQLTDCREIAEREGWEIVGEFSDEGCRPTPAIVAQGSREPVRGPWWPLRASWWPSTRIGSPVARRRPDAPSTWSRSSRRSVGRGDARCQDDFFADPRIGPDGRADGDAEHRGLGAQVGGDEAGHARRKERGAPVGPMPLGYTVEKKVVDGDTVTERVIDPAAAATVERIFDLVESGSTSATRPGP